MNSKETFEYLAVISGIVIGFMFGEINNIFYALCALCVLDYITGVMVAIKQKELSSKVGYVGIMKKIGIFILVSVTHLIDNYIVGSGNIFMSATMLYYAANEGISITENLEKLGVPISPKVSDILHQVKSENGEGKKDKEEKTDTDK